eukprot:2174689-Amphidinium_carterae.1
MAMHKRLEEVEVHCRASGRPTNAQHSGPPGLAEQQGQTPQQRVEGSEANQIRSMTQILQLRTRADQAAWAAPFPLAMRPCDIVNTVLVTDFLTLPVSPQPQGVGIWSGPVSALSAHGYDPTFGCMWHHRDVHPWTGAVDGPCLDGVVNGMEPGGAGLGLHLGIGPLEGAHQSAVHEQYPSLNLTVPVPLRGALQTRPGRCGSDKVGENSGTTQLSLLKLGMATLNVLTLRDGKSGDKDSDNSAFVGMVAAGKSSQLAHACDELNIQIL